MSKLKTNRTDIAKTLRSYSMIFVLIAIVILSQVLTGGLTLKPRNITNIILQQSYIVILILGMLPVILAVGKGIPGVPMEQLCILLVLSIGIMGCLTPYATGPGVIIYGCGYVKSKDYWRLGAIFGVIYISMLLLVGWPILAMWN